MPFQGGVGACSFTLSKAAHAGKQEQGSHCPEHTYTFPCRKALQRPISLHVLQACRRVAPLRLLSTPLGVVQAAETRRPRVVRQADGSNVVENIRKVDATEVKFMSFLDEKLA